MILTRHPVASAAWRMGVAVAVVVVPDWADIAGIGIEEEFRHGENAAAFACANGTSRAFRRLSHRSFKLENGAATGTGEVVFGHEFSCLQL
jgi:hypothetical protein